MGRKPPRTSDQPLPLSTRLSSMSPESMLAEKMHVAVDPDEFPLDKKGTFIAYYADAEGHWIAKKLDIDTYIKKRPFPLFLVNTSPVDQPLPCPPYSGGGGNNYVSVTKVRLHQGGEQGAIGYEEF